MPPLAHGTETLKVLVLAGELRTLPGSSASGAVPRGQLSTLWGNRSAATQPPTEGSVPLEACTQVHVRLAWRCSLSIVCRIMDLEML